MIGYFLKQNSLVIPFDVKFNVENCIWYVKRKYLVTFFQFFSQKSPQINGFLCGIVGCNKLAVIQFSSWAQYR